MESKWDNRKRKYILGNQLSLMNKGTGKGERFLKTFTTKRKKGDITADHRIF